MRRFRSSVEVSICFTKYALGSNFNGTVSRKMLGLFETARKHGLSPRIRSQKPDSASFINEG